MRRFLISFAILATLITGAYFALPTEVFAQVETGLEAVGDVVKLPDTDPIIIATRIINISLGFLGIIMVSLMVYAGFLWMTSGGEATKVDKAKKIITSAVIGSVIILSSWAITRFILERLIDAASGPSGVPGAPPPPGGGFGGPGSTQVFQVKSITPQGDVSIRNVQVKLLFSRPVDENTATAIVITNGDNTTVGGTLAVNESLVTFTPSDPCPEPNQDLKCFDGDSDYTVSVQDTLRSTQNQAIVCGGFSPSCTANFHTGNLVDTRDPMVNMNAPIDGQGVPADELVALMAQAEDDSGVAYVEFLDGVELVDQSAPNEEQTPLSFLAEGLWDTAGAELQSVHQLFAKAYDIDDHEKQSSAVSVIVRPPSCFNEVQDGEETGIDCGGTPNTSGYCGACEGNSCTSDQQCSSGVCADGICVDKPIISSVGPLDGRPGTFVTIKGVNFGSSGFVVFVGGPDAIDDKVASVPQVCQQLGGKMWTKTQVIVEVPEGAVTGPIQLQNGASQLSDRTDDERGPIIQDFMVSDQTYPGLCGLDPDQGFVGGKFTAIGQGFGQSPSTMNFGKLALNQFSSWSDAQVVANIPVAGAGNHAVKIVVDNIESNPADFEIISKAKAGPPQIFSLDPERGPRGEYVTLSGKNFGYSVGTVRFKNKLSREEALADVSFPAACAEGFWTETSVIVKVPQSFLNAQSVSVGDYTIRLIRADNVETNEMDFSINDQAAKPGICAISPNVGPIGTEVTMAGERFGTDTGDITFSENKAGISASWKNNEIKTEVSAGAITGPVIITAQGVKSNPAFFQVRNCNEQPGICSKDEQCCGNGSCVPAEQGCPSVSLSAMFAWQSSTGFIPVAPRVVEECKPDAKQPPVPSPSPWDGRSKGNQVCVNATINARFTTHLDETTVTGSNFKFSKCTGKEDDPCQSTEPVELSGGFPLLQAASQDQDLVTLEAKAGLEQDTTYSVEILTGVKGKGIAGANMDESPRCESGVAYCFTFKTRNLPDPCQLGGVIVSPHPYELNDAGVKVAYLASPLAAEDKCIVLNAQAYEPWGWDHSNNNAIYDTPLKENPETGQVWHKQIGIAVSETGDTPVLMSSIAKGIKGVAELYIRFIPPRVDAFAPNCQKACINALIWARFNTAIDPASITDNVEVRPCANENCIVSELSQALPIPKVKINVTVVPKSADEEEGKILRFLRIEPVDTNGQILLLPGKFYRVLLRGGDEQGIRGMHGVPMTGLNDPEGFIWTFRTKLGENAYCGAQSVDVSPLEKIETVVGARQMFQATPFGAPDECSMLGQALVQTESAVWDSSDKLVADFFEGGKLDTGGTLPARCNSMCLATGAQAEFGKVAVCGNSIIETTNPAYCTEYLKKWPGLCSVLPNGAKAGEECDPGIPSNKGQCDELTCLWKPVTQVPNGTCGNDKWDEFGEECDFGSICMGAAPTSTTPDGTICTSLQVRATCEANKGTCAPRQIRGCSPFCRKTGSRSGDSTCGNSDVADGEDCDDGNVANGDGCSSNCLHEGSSAVIASVCGNAILEPGETCEKPNLNNLFPAGCDQIRCLHIGSALCDNDPKTPNVDCCGNADIDAGEDCDDGNKTSGDGCNVSCLLEGSSVAYPNPSYCSDGVKEKGEQCESEQKGDGMADAAQLAEIIGNTDPDEDGLMKSTISADLLSQTGNATYGLQCGFTSYQSCPSGFGLTDQGCCNVRPELANSEPKGEDVCRNAQIKASFNTDIDLNSLRSNVRIAKKLPPQITECPVGTQQVTADFRPVEKGFKSWIKNLWKKVTALWTGELALAKDIWCMGSVTGSWTSVSEKNSKEFVFNLDTALEAETVYYVTFLGDQDLNDNSDVANKKGIKTARGVVAKFDPKPDSGPLTFSFKTDDQICGVNVIEVFDDSEEHPLLFLDKDELPHPFYAVAKSIQNGKSVSISSVEEYKWEWQPWSTSDITVVNVVNPPNDKTKSNIKPENKNGTAFVTAMLEVTQDEINDPPEVKKSVHGTASVTVLLCENPWPNLDKQPIAPFRDKEPTAKDGKDSSLTDSIFESGPYFNFSTTYCRDAGEFDIEDDIPSLKIAYVPLTPAAKVEGIMREYLFTYGDDRPDLKKDGIGIRIASNPLHYSPEEWYKWRGFGGTPTSFIIDGYQAIQDETTLYVAAANTEGPGQSIYSNIY
ncbi:Ig-like domain-containing protein, partial [Patescibacteria group bacterium]|nr:Ig-like domain-containing protein [Patescibacteria group bacterium]